MSEAILENKCRKPILLTVLGMVVCVGMLAMPSLAGLPRGEAMPDLVRFIGRFHPVILHLPIGILSLVVFIELGSVFCRDGKSSTRTALFFGAATSVLAVMAGFLLFQGDSDWADSPGASRHMWGGIAFSSLAIMTFLVKAWTDSGASAAWFYRFLLLACAGVMIFASHDGASLTHGPDYLTKYAPPSLKPLLGGSAAAAAVVEKPAAELLVYADVVTPILEEKCWKCHNEKKVKGKFRMDTYELLVKGGKEEKGIEPGNADKSSIIIRSGLPIDDDERMPPDEKPGLTADEVLTIKWWINAGASPTQKLAEANAPAEVLAAIAKRVPAAPKENPAVSEAAAQAETGKRAALQKTVDEVQKSFPGAVQFESQATSGLTFTAVSMRGKFGDDDMAKLSPVITGLVSCDLSASLITDKSLALLAPAKDLHMLRLSETKITDAGLDSVAKMVSLESLNIYGTEISDAGLQKLVGLAKLKRLYVWRSKITPAGIEEFKKKRPDCVIETGI
jgi:uncharacterized membrane protein